MNDYKSCGRRPRNVQDPTPKVRLWVEIDPDVRRELIALAYERGVTFSHLIRTILSDALAAVKP